MKLIYLLGAGRSGTTILATVLGNANGVITLGEMHQFLESIIEDKPCSCGQILDKCEFWKPVVKKLTDHYDRESLLKVRSLCESVEKHKYIPISFIKNHRRYFAFQLTLIKIIQEIHPSFSYLDSSKYISKALQLNNGGNLIVKNIYVVRDVRGVISSFKKKVQSPKKPLGTIVYYTLINFFGELFYRLKNKDTLKVKYEDFVEKPLEVVQQIQTFTNIDLKDVLLKIENKESFSTPHIIAGNRLVSNRKVLLNKDFTWKKKLSKWEKIIYYILTLPLMIINKYTL